MTSISPEMDLMIKAMLGIISFLSSAGCVWLLTKVMSLNDRLVQLEERNRGQQEDWNRRVKEIAETTALRFSDRSSEREHEQEMIKLQLSGLERQHLQENGYLKEQLTAIKETQVGLHRRFDELLISLDPKKCSKQGT